MASKRRHKRMPKGIKQSNFPSNLSKHNFQERSQEFYDLLLSELRKERNQQEKSIAIATESE